MALDQAAFNATLIAIQNNESDFAPYLARGQLDLNNSTITDSDVLLLVNALKTNTSITSLNLGANQISDFGISTLVEILKANVSLIDLYLQYNQITDAGASMLVNILKNNTLLKTLYLGGIRMSNTGVTALADMLKVNRSLIQLYIANSNINDTDVVVLAEALAVNTSLISFYIGSNPITDAGAQTLITALATNYYLLSINLETTFINPNYLSKINALLTRNIAITQAITQLKNNVPTLTLLDLSNREINDVGVALIAEALQQNTFLTSLNFHNNQMTATGANTLLKALQNNYSIIILNVLANSIGSQNILDQINALLMRNQQYPSFSFNYITATEGKIITLSKSNIAATLITDFAPFGPITYTVSDVMHGKFTNLANQTITIFTQDDINSGTIRFAADDFNKIPPSYKITASNGNFTTPTHIGTVKFIPINHAPVLMHPVANQEITVNNPFELQLANNIFQDPDHDPLQFSLTLENGAALPEYLQFNSSSNTLSGRLNTTGIETLELTATDSSNLTAAAHFNLTAFAKTTTDTSSVHSDASVGVIAGIVTGLGALAAGGLLLWKRLRSQQSAIAPEANNTVPMVDNLELMGLAKERSINYVTVQSTDESHTDEEYEKPKPPEPLYVTDWLNPPVSNSLIPWSDQYDTTRPPSSTQPALDSDGYVAFKK